MNAETSSPIMKTQATQVGMFSQFITQAYMWLSGGLLITSVLSLYISDRIFRDVNFALSVLNLIPFIFLAELITVIAISWGYKRMNFGLLSVLFVAYSLMNGVFFGVVLTAYSLESTLLTFIATMATFVIMSLYGAITKQDLTKFGNIALMGLVGLILASILNIFFVSESLYWITTYLGIIIFVVLIAFDTQKLKQMQLHAEEHNEPLHKLAVMGALTLYLDLINLFLYLLRIFGNRR